MPGGSGAGSFNAGELIRDPTTLELGDLLISWTPYYAEGGCTNVVVVDEVQTHPGRGFYGHFVDPNDPSKKRLPSDHTFFVWDFALEGPNTYHRAVKEPACS